MDPHDDGRRWPVSVELEIKVTGLAAVALGVGRLAALRDRGRVLGVVGALVESQTRRRLSSEKQDPKGRPWKSWSAGYEARRPGSGGLLDLRGHLIDSIRYDAAGDGVEVGSNLVYARRHQLGDRGGKPMPQREFIGLSSANEKEITDVVNDWLMEGLA